MKKLALTLASVLLTLGALGQGSVNFNNSPGAVGSASGRIFGVDGTTPLAGAGFQAILYAGPNSSSLQAIGASLPFRSGAGAGYVDTTGIDPARVIPTVLPGAVAVVQVRAWDVASGATWDVATTRGQSPDLNVTTGGAGSPPSLPANLTGLQGFSLSTTVIPEPSTVALGLLGIGALLIRRRK